LESGGLLEDILGFIPAGRLCPNPPVDYLNSGRVASSVPVMYPAPRFFRERLFAVKIHTRGVV